MLESILIPVNYEIQEILLLLLLFLFKCKMHFIFAKQDGAINWMMNK